MPAYCDVALPVPLDRTFTYAVNGAVPEVGARVLVPFSGQRLLGVVVRVHDDAPPKGVEIKIPAALRVQQHNQSDTRPEYHSVSQQPIVVCASIGCVG